MEPVQPLQNRSKDTRKRILTVALELFASQGFARTSTRQIAQVAQVNLSAIKYYFNDKEGLYRAAYKEPLGTPAQNIEKFSMVADLEDSLYWVFEGMVSLLKKSNDIRLCIKLHMREMLEPTGLWEEAVRNDIMPHHEGLLKLIRSHIPSISEDDAHRLVFSVMSMGVFIFANQELINKIHPQLLNTSQALDEWHQKMVLYAKAMIQAQKDSESAKI